jgi:hypothetical protein
LIAMPATTAASPWAGVWIAEDVEQIVKGVQDGSWVDGTLGTIAAGLDGLAIISDPVGALLQYGVAWLIEHVKPLSQALDWLAGDPARISAPSSREPSAAPKAGGTAATPAKSEAMFRPAPSRLRRPPSPRSTSSPSAGISHAWITRRPTTS